MGAALEAFLREAEGTPILVLGDERSLETGLPDGVETAAVGVFDETEASAGSIALEAIRRGVAYAGEGAGRALVTGPVHKPALHAAGVRVPGQTEFLQSLTGAPAVGMLMHATRTRLGDRPLRILLATTHVALREVPDRLTSELLVQQTRLLDDALRKLWRLPCPRIGLCGLNPHASDEGLFGDEEARIMVPARRLLAGEGRRVEGPFPADTVFLKALEGELDAIVTPYHDVGMAVFKTLAFGHGVNTTLGLPFPRTSPDHGTAFDLAGKGRANPGSALESLRLALRLAWASCSAPSGPDASRPNSLEL